MIPKNVDVLGITCPVKQCDMKKHLDEDALGLADLLANKIYIEKFVPDAVKPRLLVHEAAHIALWHSGIHFCLNDSEIETLCQIISTLYFELKKQGI